MGSIAFSLLSLGPLAPFGAEICFLLARHRLPAKYEYDNCILQAHVKNTQSKNMDKMGQDI